MSVEIRAPEEADLEGLFDCLRAYGFYLIGSSEGLADPDFPEDAILGLRNRITSLDVEERCFVAVDGSEVLGACAWDWIDEARGTAKTVLIHVLPAARRRGVGARLQERRMLEMRRRGAVELHTWSVDPESVAWYERHFGYRAVGAEPVRHALHRWQWRDRVFWGLHRGSRGHAEMTHLVADLRS